MQSRSVSGVQNGNPIDQATLTDGIPFRTGPMLDLIDIAHGPRHILGRFFLAADAEARARGIELFFATFEEMAELNRRHSDSWKPVIPLFLPENGMVQPENSFCIIGRNQLGEAVTCQAGRFFDWTETSFKAEAEALRIFYPDSQIAMEKGEMCFVQAPSAASLGGRISYSGGAWYRPDYRGRYIAGIMARLSRALAHASWNTQTTVAVISKALHDRGYAFRTGYAHQELGFELRNFPLGPYSGAVCWIHTDEMLADLEKFPEQLGEWRQRDGVVDLRGAKK